MRDVALAPLLVSTVIFVLTYVGIFSERVHRTIVSLAGAVGMIVIGTWLGFYSDTAAVETIDFNTITLLLGMMIVVGILHKTGLFTYLAIRAAQLTKGSPWRMMLTLGLVTTIVSMVLDNVTTLLVVAPVTLSIAEVMGMNVVPLLMSEALLSNTGGVATLIGDPPNVLIGSAAHLSFNDFLIHLGPIVLVAWLVTQTLLMLIFRRELKEVPTNKEKLAHLNAKRALSDPNTAKKMLIILGLMVLLFLVHDRINLNPGVVALIGAATGLLWVHPPVEEILNEVHWDILLFFLSLFVVVGGLKAAGVLDVVAEAITGITSHGIIIASLVVLWISAIMSALVDNIPFTIVMLPIIAGLASRGVNAAPLWWALALGVGFGGNGTPIGSTANVLTVSISERSGTPITFKMWIKSGSLTAIASCIVASVALIIAIKLGLFV